MVVNYRVIRLVPISNKNSVIAIGIWEGDWNSWATEDSDASKTTSGLVECKRWEIIKASYLVLDLENVCKVLSWRNWACGSDNTIFI